MSQDQQKPNEETAKPADDASKQQAMEQAQQEAAEEREDEGGYQ